MKREKMASIAQTTVNNMVFPEPGCRVVIVVTDAKGQWVGVGTSTSARDTEAILLYALAGDDRVDHPQPGKPKEAK